MLDVQVKISYDLLKISLLHYEKGAGAKCDAKNGDLEESIVKIVTLILIGMRGDTFISL